MLLSAWWHCVCVSVCVSSAASEAKLLLWWSKIVQLCLRQVDFGEAHRPVVKVLLAVIPSLVTLGEDKSSAGLLGAIGLGRKSQLSHRYEHRPATTSITSFLACTTRTAS